MRTYQNNYAWPIKSCEDFDRFFQNKPGRGLTISFGAVNRENRLARKGDKILLASIAMFDAESGIRYAEISQGLWDTAKIGLCLIKFALKCFIYNLNPLTKKE